MSDPDLPNLHGDDEDPVVGPALDALHAMVDWDQTRCADAIDAIIGLGKNDTLAATIGWAHAIVRIALPDDGSPAILESLDGPIDEVPPDEALAMRIIACIANSDVDTACSLWSAVPDEVAIKATIKVLTIAADVVRQQAVMSS